MTDLDTKIIQCKIVNLINKDGPSNLAYLMNNLGYESSVIEPIISEMIKDGYLHRTQNRLYFPTSKASKLEES